MKGLFRLYHLRASQLEVRLQPRSVLLQTFLTCFPSRLYGCHIASYRMPNSPQQQDGDQPLRMTAQYALSTPTVACP